MASDRELRTLRAEHKLELRVLKLEVEAKAEEKARRLAAKEIDRRLEGMNELREQITSERGKYVERELYEERHQILVAGLQDMTNKVGGLEAHATANRRSVAAMIGVATLFLSLVVALANILAR